MKKRAGDAASSATAVSEHLVLGVEKFGQTIIVAGGVDRGVMELVTAQDRAGAAERAVRQQPRAAVAEMQLALGKTRGMAEQAGHVVNAPVGVLQALAQHHVA